MTKVLVALTTAVLLSGCFGVRLGGGTPDDYQGEMLTMRPRDEVAQCIAQTVHAGAPVDNGQALVVTSTDQQAGNRYTITAKDDETRVLVQGIPSDESQRVALCLPMQDPRRAI